MKTQKRAYPAYNSNSNISSNPAVKAALDAVKAPDSQKWLKSPAFICTATWEEGNQLLPIRESLYRLGDEIKATQPRFMRPTLVRLMEMVSERGLPVPVNAGKQDLANVLLADDARQAREDAKSLADAERYLARQKRIAEKNERSLKSRMKEAGFEMTEGAVSGNAGLVPFALSALAASGDALYGQALYNDSLDEYLGQRQKSVDTQREWTQAVVEWIVAALRVSKVDTVEARHRTLERYRQEAESAEDPEVRRYAAEQAERYECDISEYLPAAQVVLGEPEPEPAMERTDRRGVKAAKAAKSEYYVRGGKKARGGRGAVVMVARPMPEKAREDRGVWGKVKAAAARPALSLID